MKFNLTLIKTIPVLLRTGKEFPKSYFTLATTEPCENGSDYFSALRVDGRRRNASPWHPQSVSRVPFSNKSEGNLKKNQQPAKSKGKVKTNPKIKGCIHDAKLVIYVPFFLNKLTGYVNQEELKRIVDKQVLFHDNLIKNHGVADGTARFKAINLYASSLLEGRTPEKLPWVAVGKVDFWPSKLSHLRPIYKMIKDHHTGRNPLDNNIVKELYRFIQTMFKINRIKQDYAELELENIQQRHKLDPDFVKDFEQFVRNFFKGYESKISLIEELVVKPHFSSSRGPNSLPMEESADMEAYRIVYHEPKMFEWFNRFCKETGNLTFMNYMELRAEAYKKLIDSGEIQQRKILLRKLTSVTDKGNKSRTIAICDFWTQSLLTGLEKSIIRLSVDLFGNNIAYKSHHAGFIDIIKQDFLTEIVSLDATAWTDNFPSSLQHIVLKHCYRQVVADAWKALAVNCVWELGNSDRTIKYGKGQAMGTKGSFVIAQATCVLFIKYFMMKEYGSELYFKEVGDDLAIQDPNFISQGYFESIGVPINIQKSKKATQWGAFIEFVSRNSWNGLDTSVISPNLLTKFRQNNFYIFTVLYHLRERGFDVTLSQLLEYKISSFQIEGKKYNPDLWETEKRKILILASILSLTLNMPGLIENPESYLLELDSEQLKSFILGLIIQPAMRVLDFYSNQDDSRETRIEQERYFIYAQNYELMDEKSLWRLAIDNKLTLSQIKSVKSLTDIYNRRELKTEAGYRASLDDSNIPNLISTVTDSSGETKTINIDALRFLIDINLEVSTIVTDHKLVRKLSLLDKANTMALLELMGSLNRALDYKFNSDSETVNFQFGKKKVLTFDSDSVSNVLSQLKIKHYINDLKDCQVIISSQESLTDRISDADTHPVIENKFSSPEPTEHLRFSSYYEGNLGAQNHDGH